MQFLCKLCLNVEVFLVKSYIFMQIDENDQVFTCKIIPTYEYTFGFFPSMNIIWILILNWVERIFPKNNVIWNLVNFSLS